MTIQETPQNAWAFTLARRCFGEEKNPLAKEAYKLFELWLQDAIEQENSEAADQIRACMKELNLNEPNRHYEPDEAAREQKVREMVERMIREYGDHETFLARTEPGFIFELTHSDYLISTH